MLQLWPMVQLFMLKKCWALPSLSVLLEPTGLLHSEPQVVLLVPGLQVAISSPSQAQFPRNHVELSSMAHHCQIQSQIQSQMLSLSRLCSSKFQTGEVKQPTSLECIPRSRGVWIAAWSFPLHATPHETEQKEPCRFTVERLRQRERDKEQAKIPQLYTSLIACYTLPFFENYITGASLS